MMNRSNCEECTIKYMQLNRSNGVLFAIVATALSFAYSHGAFAEEANGALMPEAAATVTQIQPTPPKDDFCANIADFASDARHALQMKQLEDLQKKIDQKIAILEEKRAENRDFSKKRDEAMKTTQKGIVDIFAKMKPDVAAAQFEILDVETSASILRQLNARVASTILNEMKAPLAAAITARMAKPLDDMTAGKGT
jgi:flagellar motility protein MotE (MotC chaperone)